MDSKLTPMMKQYMDIKKKYHDEILFFRMGDFYEMFFDDAHVASKILDIALTSRQNSIPMCGLPYHAAESYIARLIKAGKNVAICEQLETVPSSGTVVKREVVRVITPGTVIESNLLQSDDNNFLGSVIIDDGEIGLAFVDISTGDFFISSIKKSMELFSGEIVRYNPSEIVFREGRGPEDGIYLEYIKSRDIPVYKINDWLYDADYMSDLICSTFDIISTKGLGINTGLEIATAGSILQYLKDTQKKSFHHLKFPEKIQSTDRMVLDESTQSNLELIFNLNDRTKNRTLFSVLNLTKTPMGRRTLEKNILHPLLDREKIEKRLDIVQYFYQFHELAGRVSGHLKGVYDTERILSRITMGRVFARDFISIMSSVESSMKIKEMLAGQPENSVSELSRTMPGLTGLAERIRATIEDEPAHTPEHGRVIRKGFNSELDRLYGIKLDAKTWIINYQEEEKKRLRIPTLKIKYNKILGYYIEISKGQASKTPEHYMTKQTLVSSDRFTTEKLQEFESEIFTASDSIMEIEKEELERIKSDILMRQKELQKMSVMVGEIDFYLSLSQSAVENNFTRPGINEDNITIVKNGRHPVVEKYFTREVFIPNDIVFNNSENIIKIITGPNMSGKSTYIRMAAVIQLMAQIGSFIPAQEANISIADRIFTRIGASDNISRGESTFLVEMNETANILNNATERSLIIMDEVGRGTSTYDGLSIAWAVVEYISRYMKSKTLFATHYHELTQLGGKGGICNYNVLVKEHINGVDFLHKIAEGGADKSYGIHVARLAGIPKQIIARAHRILEKLESKSQIKRDKYDGKEDESSEQLEIFNAANHLVVQAIKNIDTDNLKPIDALNELHRLKSLIR